MRAQGRKGDDGSHKACPPPPCRGTGAAPRACAMLASCLRHACNEGKTTSPPPPNTHTSAPPRVGDEGREGRTAPPPPPRTKRQGGEAAERGYGTDHTTVPEGSTRRASPSGGGTGGANAGWKGRRREPHGRPPSPAEGQVPRLVPAPCLRRAYAGERTARAPPPPPPSPPPTKERGEDSEEVARGHGGGTEDRPTCQGKRRAASGGDAKKKKKPRTKQTNAPEEESEKTGTKTAANGGRPGRHGPAWDAGEVPDHGDMGAPKGKPPPHRCSHALCLRRACVMPATCVLQREDDKGDKGDDGSGTRTPPRGHRGRVGRQRREGAGRTTRPCPKGAHAVQAPTGGPPGVRPHER